ncbi:MAG: ATP-binding protein [Methanobrevibacter sp.]|jgi:predicted transcriptional regulator|nr:ATP-binding protein [Methanobrevibacter sp.]
MLPWGNNTQLSGGEFYNRKNEIEILKSLLNTTSTGSPPAIIMPGIRGVGKSVLLKKIKKEMENDYLISYIDLTKSYGYQMGNLDEKGIIEEFYSSWIKASKEKNFNTLLNQIKMKIKSKTFEIRDIVDVGGFPVPVPKTEDDIKGLLEYTMELPQNIYNKHKKNIKGCIMIIDEIQALKDLGKNLDSFLWFFRSIIQNQRNVAYIFSGSLSSKDELLEQIGGSSGAFGGRMLTTEIKPFSIKTTENYLKERVPELKFTVDGFERFYYCTKGIPYYINIFANLLEKNKKLNKESITKEFKRNLTMLADHLKLQWAVLNHSEQKILTILLDKPVRRKDISLKLNRTSNSLSKPINNLIKKGLIEKNGKGTYYLTEQILKAWLKEEFKTNGVYPFRTKF